MEDDLEKYEELEPVILAPAQGPHFAVRRSKVRRLPNGYAVLIEDNYSVELANGTCLKRCEDAEEAIFAAQLGNTKGLRGSTLADKIGAGNRTAASEKSPVSTRPRSRSQRT
jgi:hypothetical protein